jgi:hypothetical protein
MSGDSAPEYWKSMNEEIRNLEKRDTWSVVLRSKAGNNQIVPGTWAFMSKLVVSANTRVDFVFEVTFKSYAVKGALPHLWMEPNC